MIREIHAPLSVLFLCPCARLSLRVAPCSAMHRLKIFLILVLVLLIGLCTSVQTAEHVPSPESGSEPLQGSVLAAHSSSLYKWILSSFEYLFPSKPPVAASAESIMGPNSNLNRQLRLYVSFMMHSCCETLCIHANSTFLMFSAVYRHLESRYLQNMVLFPFILDSGLSSSPFTSKKKLIIISSLSEVGFTLYCIA